MIGTKKYYIDDRIFSVKFACDVNKCKGACCTTPGTIGAPLLSEEIGIIEEILDITLKYIPAKNAEIIYNEGFYAEIDGKLSLHNVNDNECVFSYIECGIAKCAFQKAYNIKETSFKKPVSCELYPVRVYGEQRNDLRYDKRNECEDALEKGKYENITVFEYVKEALVRAFGEDFYTNMMKFIKK